jgi:hypothetical protein
VDNWYGKGDVVEALAPHEALAFARQGILASPEVSRRGVELRERIAEAESRLPPQEFPGE